MDNKVKNINDLIASIESRNEKLNEELLQNNKALAEMREELAVLLENDVVETNCELI